MNKIEKHIITCMVKTGVKFVSVYKRRYTGDCYVFGFGYKNNGEPGWVYAYFSNDHLITEEPSILWYDRVKENGMYESSSYIDGCVEPFYENVANYDVEPIPDRRGFVKHPCLMGIDC